MRLSVTPLTPQPSTACRHPAVELLVDGLDGQLESLFSGLSSAAGGASVPSPHRDTSIGRWSVREARPSLLLWPDSLRHQSWSGHSGDGPGSPAPAMP